MKTKSLCWALGMPFVLVACSSGDESIAGGNAGQDIANIGPVDQVPFQTEEIATFDQPWAMAFMPGSSKLFVTEMKGAVKFIDVSTGETGSIASGLPEVSHGGQGGLGDIAFAPDWAAGDTDGILYLSWVEAGEGNLSGAVVGRGNLTCDQANSCQLEGLDVIWRQSPKETGQGHFSHRIAFSRDGEHLFISSGDRQKMEPAQDLTNTLGTVVRLNLDGSVPDSNPYADRASPTNEIWSLGHRNILGLAFDNNGNLWASEMGPKGGDELNLVRRGANYGWPLLSNGVHYDDRDIPDHPAKGEEGERIEVAGGAMGYTGPKESWNPAISPANLLFYDGSLFVDWTNSLFIGGLSGETLIRVELDDQQTRIANRWPMNARIRELEQGPQGEIWVLVDGRQSDRAGMLMKLTPSQRAD